MQLIVAVDEAWGIGNHGDQLVYIPDDLKRFQALTTGHPILVGRKTLATFPGGRPLKNRTNFILSTQSDYTVEDAIVVHSLEETLDLVPEDTFVVGGALVYAQLLPYCDIAYVTKLHRTFPADTQFPNLEEDPQWELVESDGPYEHEDLSYTYLIYERRDDNPFSIWNLLEEFG